MTRGDRSEFSPRGSDGQATNRRPTGLVTDPLRGLANGIVDDTTEH
jgi:hypothetical protein